MLWASFWHSCSLLDKLWGLWGLLGGFLMDFDAILPRFGVPFDPHLGPIWSSCALLLDHLDAVLGSSFSWKVFGAYIGDQISFCLISMFFLSDVCVAADLFEHILRVLLGHRA